MTVKKIFRISELVKFIGVSRSMIYLYLNKKSKYYNAEFPRPIKLSERSVGWKYEDIERFINSRNYQ
ncbi:AlpA family phage regulatory protein [Orbus wheelerorum]|uniref:helix-turn-helix transcriptional regulator n=1 Tax=Orbus wheelerorum TaxID=3074111 RepID=UPI00370D2867